MTSGYDKSSNKGSPQPTRDAIVFGLIVVLIVAASVFFPA